MLSFLVVAVGLPALAPRSCKEEMDSRDESALLAQAGPFARLP